MQQVLVDIITLLTGGISQMAQGIGAGLAALVQQIFLTGAGTTESPYGLSTFGGVIVIFAGISLAVGLSKLIVNWVTSLGAN